MVDTTVAVTTACDFRQPRVEPSEVEALLPGEIPQ
jgi:hypothetical protein